MFEQKGRRALKQHGLWISTSNFVMPHKFLWEINPNLCQNYFLFGHLSQNSLHLKYEKTFCVDTNCC